VLIACGSSDFKARVYSAHIKEIDDKPPTTNWGTKLVYGNVLQEFPTAAGGWVHGIRFSPSGDKLAWVGHDSTISVVDAAQGMMLTVIKTEFLPFIDALWTNESNIIAAGFDCSPMLFSFNGQAINFVSKCDSEGKQQAEKKFSAMDHFKTRDSKAATESVETVLNSIHQNSITMLTFHSGSKEKCSKFSTSGADGQLVIWDAK